jgi:hypothetical protein
VPSCRASDCEEGLVVMAVDAHRRLCARCVLIRPTAG